MCLLVVLVSLVDVVVSLVLWVLELFVLLLVVECKCLLEGFDDVYLMISL